MHAWCFLHQHLYQERVQECESACHPHSTTEPSTFSWQLTNEVDIFVLICCDLPFRLTLNFQKLRCRGNLGATPACSPPCLQSGLGRWLHASNHLIPTTWHLLAMKAFSTGPGTQTGNVVWVRGHAHQDHHYRSHGYLKDFMRPSVGAYLKLPNANYESFRFYANS